MDVWPSPQEPSAAGLTATCSWMSPESGVGAREESALPIAEKPAYCRLCDGDLTKSGVPGGLVLHQAFSDTFVSLDEFQELRHDPLAALRYPGNGRIPGDAVGPVQE